MLKCGQSSLMTCAHHVWEQLCWKTDSCELALATYADNIFSTGSCSEDAVTILQDCELYLGEWWDLHLGADSKQIIVPKSTKRVDPGVAHAGYEQVADIKILGRVYSDNGGLETVSSSSALSLARLLGQCRQEIFGSVHQAESRFT